MSPEQKTQIIDVTKVSSLWAAVGISSWSEFAAAAASVYSVILIGEWFWRRLIRSYAERYGLVSRRLRRKDDQDE